MLAGIRHKLKLIRYKGNRYECPFCGYRAAGFFPIGEELPVLRELEVIGGGKRNCGCYKCGSYDRERLVYLYIRDELKLAEGGQIKSVLHIAPEQRLSDKLRAIKQLNYVCGDLFTEGYAYPDYVKNMDVTSIPFPDQTYDLVICNHVLEHVPDDLKAMREIFRVLKPGGQAVLQVPFSKKITKTLEDPNVTDPKEREQKFGQFDHLRIYGADYFDRLRQSGFTVSAVNISERYPKAGLNNAEDIFVIQKK